MQLHFSPPQRVCAVLTKTQQGLTLSATVEHGLRHNMSLRKSIYFLRNKTIFIVLFDISTRHESPLIHSFHLISSPYMWLFSGCSTFTKSSSISLLSVSMKNLECYSLQYKRWQSTQHIDPLMKYSACKSNFKNCGFELGTCFSKSIIIKYLRFIYAQIKEKIREIFWRFKDQH